MKVDVRLYVIVDPAACAGRDPLRVADMAARGGATIIQLRDKHGQSRRRLQLARRMKEVLAAHGVPLVINDDVPLAAGSGADGAHVGQDDMAVAEARGLLGEEAIIGLSHQTAGHVDASPVDELDYVAIGGVFATSSKKQARAPIGPEGLRALSERLRRRAPDMPVVAIAGVDASNAAGVIEAGADGVAVISAVCAAEDPLLAARRLRRRVDAALAARRGEGA